MIPKTDEELYKDFLNGDNSAFEQIVIKYHTKITYFIKTITQTLDSAEDLAQDVFVYILLHKEYYDPKYSLKAYLYTIAKSRAINYVNKEKRKLDVEDLDTIFVDTTDLDENINNKDKLEKINLIIKKLKPQYQEVIYLAEYEGLSNPEIAKILNKTTLQVKTMLYNARKKLKELLNKEGITYDE